MATAKKIPNENYQVQLTLSPVEARYLYVITGRVCGHRPVDAIWSELDRVLPLGPSMLGEPTYNYENLSQLIRDWVENGE